MLILSRKILETIMIGDDIQVKVLSFDGISVRLGISAPRSIPIHRTEIYTRLNLQVMKNKNDPAYIHARQCIIKYRRKKEELVT